MAIEDADFIKVDFERRVVLLTKSVISTRTVKNIIRNSNTTGSRCVARVIQSRMMRSEG